MNDEKLQDQTEIKSLLHEATHTTYGDYEILEKIGSGGMGLVYKVKQRSMERVCAMKVMNKEDDDESLKRFINEAKLVCTLDHPNIVKVFSVEVKENNNAYLVMEWLDGNSLADHLKEKRRLSIAEFRNIFAQVLQALSYAHQRGIIHRDIKPGNIFICNTRESGNLKLVKLLDFGIAKDSCKADDERLTRTGAILGTPAYMSPEQARGEAPGSASDVYSLGVLMYECLTGTAPFSGDTALDLMYKHMKDDVDTSRLPASAAYAGLNACIIRCLDKVPANRYANAIELLAAISKVWDLPDWDKTRARSSSRRNLLLIAGVATVCLLSALALSKISLRQEAQMAEESLPSASSMPKLTGLRGLHRAERYLQIYENHKQKRQFKLAAKARALAIQLFDDWIAISMEQFAWKKEKLKLAKNKREHDNLEAQVNNDPNYIFTAEKELGDFFRKEGDLPEAVRRYDAAARILSGGSYCVTALRNESELLCELKQGDKAVEVLSEARTRWGTELANPDALLDLVKLDTALGAAYLNLGMTTKAKEMFREACTKADSLAPAYREKIKERYPDCFVEAVDGMAKVSPEKEQEKWNETEYRLLKNANEVLQSSHELVHGTVPLTAIKGESFQRIEKCARRCAAYYEKKDPNRREELLELAHSFEGIR